MRLPATRAARLRSVSLAAALTVVGATAHADDTEIFVSQSSSLGIRPNILLVFDTSGSMNTAMQPVGKSPYRSDGSYSGVCDTAKLYWRRGPGAPPGCSTSQQFPAATNNCQASTAGLISVSGLWTGRIAQWDPEVKRWGPLNNSFPNRPIECRNDSSRHGSNASPNTARYAVNGDTGPWSSNAGDEIDWRSIAVHTLYTGKWLNWYALPANESNVSRLSTAIGAAITFAYSIEDVNLGLMRFRRFGDGGVVTQAMGDIATTREELATQLRALRADGSTPLTETLYEAGLYLAGRTVDFGRGSSGDDDDDDDEPGSVAASRLPTDQTRYRSPIEAACQKSFIILLTDGEPRQDAAADPKLPGLPQFTSINGGAGCGTDGSRSDGTGACLDNLAKYLREADLRPESTLPGAQGAITYTVAFGPDVADASFLAAAARAGGGEPFTAATIGALTDALQSIVTDIGERSSTFTTPSVAVNAFNRSQTANELYISVFEPTETARWPGNLKKYALQNGVIVDATGANAVDPITGFFSRRSRSIWTAGGTDGDQVQVGGAVSRLPAESERNIYTYIEGIGAPDEDLTRTINRFDTDNAALTDELLGTSTAEPTRAQLIEWARGVDWRDLNGNNDRAEQFRFMGDPLHGRAAVVSYGPDAADAVVYVPTNDGFVHAIAADTGRERWAFIPQELVGRLKDLYRDASVSQRGYGLDGDVRVLRFDVDQNGRIDRTAGDRVYIYFGMRRGGRSYYALDVTDPSRPQLLWRIGERAANSGSVLPGIGETWSPPTLARVHVGGATQNGEKIVLIFGGGYDAAQEGYGFANDTSGNRIYIVDAQSGRLLWYGGRTQGTDTPHLALPQMTHSIPARIAVLDTDGDAFADRMYAGDMGGRVWRFDIANGNSAGDLVTGGVFANLGAAGSSNPAIADTRRFYYAPDVALIQRRGAEPYYNVAVGSGYRGHPLHTATRDRFYSLRDRQPFKRRTQSDYNSLQPITEGSKLPDISGNLTGTSIPSDADGWMLDLRLNGAGEKVLAEAITVNGTVLFPTYQPQSAGAGNPCVPGAGINRAYALRVDTGRPALNFDRSTLDITASDAFTTLTQTGIAGEISYMLETPAAGSTIPAGDTAARDPLGRRALCMVGIEVLQACVPPGGILRTFWQRRVGGE